MIRTFEKQNKQVRAVQWNGTEKTADEIRDLLGEYAKYLNVEYMFNLKGGCMNMYLMLPKKGLYQIYINEWIVSDGEYFFCISDDIFQNMFVEVK